MGFACEDWGNNDLSSLDNKREQIPEPPTVTITLKSGIELQTVMIDNSPALFVMYDGDLILIHKEDTPELVRHLQAWCEAT